MDFIKRNWTLKVVALALAILLWTVTKAEAPTQVTLDDVPVEVALTDSEWVVSRAPVPGQVRVHFSGPARELLGLVGKHPRVVVPIDRVADSVELRPLQMGWIRLQGATGRVRVEDMWPSTVRLFFERLEARSVPVSLPTRGRPPSGVELTGPIRPDPAVVRVSGPRSAVEALDSITLDPVDLSVIRDTMLLRRSVAQPADDVTVSPAEIEVVVPVAAVEGT